MIDPIQALIEAGALPTNRYPANSRYAGTPVHTYEPEDGGNPVPYLGRRLLPQPDRLATVAEHVVVARDRLDLLAGRYLGDPELWWRIADANPVSDPDELTRSPGRRLRITLPEGMPGVPGA